jgi:hypothetical protein
MRQHRTPRAHDEEKFWVEFLGRHQLTYFTYFLAVGFGANFWLKYGWMKKALIPFVILNFIFYIRGTSKAVRVDDLFSQLPGHSCRHSADCTKSLTNAQGRSLYLFGLVTTAIILLVASGVIFFIES